MKQYFKKHKFSAKITKVDGIKFHSKKESMYYGVLKDMQRSGELLFFLRQVPFHLPGNIRCVIDFMEFWANGDIKFIDVKGIDTLLSKTKRKQVEALYPIKIELK